MKKYFVKEAGIYIVITASKFYFLDGKRVIDYDNNLDSYRLVVDMMDAFVPHWFAFVIKKQKEMKYE